MYFDAYLKGRNAPSTGSQVQSLSTGGFESNSKFAPLRPPNSQANLMIGKPPSFQEIRNDNNKPNSSAHIYLSAAKNSNLPPRIAQNNLPARPETASNFAVPPFSRHQLPDEQKYICHSPAKITNRSSAGMVFEEIPQNRYDYRRSESIADLKPNEAYRDNSSSYFNANQRQPFDFQSPNDNRTSSPIQIKFNATNAFGGEIWNKAVRKESIEGSLLSNREDRGEVKDLYSHRKSFKETYYDTLYREKPQQLTFQGLQPPKFEAFPPKASDVNRYDLEARKFETESKRIESYKPSQQTYKVNMYPSQPLLPQALKRESSQDFLKKYSTSKLPELDKSLDQDIEALRYTSKRTEEVVDREMSKNIYLNQLFEQKGLKINTDERPLEFKDTIKEKKEAAAKNMGFQREIEEKNKEIFEKNREISEKSKTIIEKNRHIEALTAELKESNERIVKKESAAEFLEALQQELKEKSNKIILLETHLKDSEQLNESKLQEKLRLIQTLQQKQSQLTITITTRQQEILLSRGELESLIRESTKKEEESQLKMQELLQENEKIKQKAESQKLSLINLYKKEVADLKSKQETQKQSFQAQKLLLTNQEGNRAFLQAEIVELRQRNCLLEDDLSVLKHNFKEVSQNYEQLRDQYLQVSSLLLLGEDFKHEMLVNRLKECIEVFAKCEGMQSKEIQRFQEYQMQKLQQEHLQRRHQELSRELKKVGSRLAGASIEAQQGGRLLRDANSQIILMNLMNLNEKYRYLLSEQ